MLNVGIPKTSGFLIIFLTGILLKLCAHNNAAQNKDDREVVFYFLCLL